MKTLKFFLKENELPWDDTSNWDESESKIIRWNGLKSGWEARVDALTKKERDSASDTSTKKEK